MSAAALSLCNEEGWGRGLSARVLKFGLRAEATAPRLKFGLPATACTIFGKLSWRVGAHRGAKFGFHDMLEELCCSWCWDDVGGVGAGAKRSPRRMLWRSAVNGIVKRRRLCGGVLGVRTSRRTRIVAPTAGSWGQGSFGNFRRMFKKAV